MPPWMIGCWIPNSSVIAVFTCELSVFRSVDDFKQTRRAHATTNAHGHHAVFRFAPPAFDQEVPGQARPRHAIGVADRDRAAIDIELVRIDAELVAAIDHLHRIGLVELPKVDVVDLQVVALQEPRDRGDRADAHLVRLDAGGNEPAEDAKRLEALLRRDLVAHDHASRGTVRELAGIASADGLALEHRLDLGQPIGGRIGARSLVLRQGHLLVGDLLGVLVDDGHPGRDRYNLVVEAATLQRSADATLTFEAVLVLPVTADLVALGNDLRGLQHRHVHLRLHRHQLLVDGVEFVHVLVLHQADRLDAAANGDLDAVEHHRARGDRDRLQSGGALAVDGGAGDCNWEAGADRALAGDVHHHGALLHGAAHHHVLDLAGRDAGALHGFGHHVSGQGRAIGVVERAARGRSDAGARGGNDYCFSRHACLSAYAAASSCA